MNRFAWRKWAAAAVSLLLVWSLAACGNSNSNAGEGKNGKSLTKLTVLLDWYPNAVHSFLYAAEEQGYFKEEGLDVHFQPPSDINDPIKLVAAGKFDLAISYQSQIIVSRAEGIPVKSVAALVRHPLNQLLVAEKSGAKSPKDITKLKIGYASVPSDAEMVKTMVKTDGGDADKLKFVDVGWDLIPSMITGKVDAIIGGYINHEQLLIEKQGTKLIAMNPADYGVPDHYELILAASEKGAKSNKKAIQAFLRAAAKGFQYTKDHPQESLDHLLKMQSKDFPLDADTEKQSLAMLLPLMDAGSEPFGSQDAESWRSFSDWMLKSGLIKDKIDPNDAFANLAK